MKINRKLIYSKYNGRCAYCGNEVEFKDFQLITLSQNQHLTATHHISTETMETDGRQSSKKRMELNIRIKMI